MWKDPWLQYGTNCHRVLPNAIDVWAQSKLAEFFSLTRRGQLCQWGWGAQEKKKGWSMCWSSYTTFFEIGWNRAQHFLNDECFFSQCPNFFSCRGWGQPWSVQDILSRFHHTWMVRSSKNGHILALWKIMVSQMLVTAFWHVLYLFTVLDKRGLQSFTVVHSWFDSWSILPHYG